LKFKFVLPETIACWASPTHMSAGGNQSDIQFLTAPACTQFSVSSPADYCHVDPDFALSCYINGDGNSGDVNNSSHAAGLDVLVSFSNTDRGQTGDGGYVPPTHIANAAEIGSVWGAAYHKAAKKLFHATILKRHMSLGPGGLGAIYLTDINTGTNSQFLDLATFGYDFGSITGRNLPIIANEANRDSLAFTLIGEVGLGDLDISSDGQTLWTVNLNSKELISIDISTYLDNGTIPTAASVNAIPIPDPSCSDGDYRPFGLGIKKGVIYLGLVCSAETSQQTTDLRGIVYKVDPTTSQFTEILNVPLDYQKGGVHGKAGGNCETFYPWTDNYDDVFFYEYNFGSSCYPQPILSDIEFDIDGSLILGFTDRYGHQSGGANYSVGESQPIGYPDPAFADPGVNINSTSGIANPPIFDGQIGGDILKAFYDANTDSYTLESNGSGGCGAGNGQGPGNGEFYCGETFTSNHFETAMGGLVHIPGTNQLISPVMDPLSILSGGVVWLSNTDGSATNADRYEIYQSSRNNPTTFSKAIGLGDIEVLCNPAPLEIGNYVWCDSLENGIQDACERGISDMIVQLYDRNGRLVGQDTTNNGQYQFNQYNVDTLGITVLAGVASPTTAWSGMSYATQYFVVFGSGQFATDEFTVGSNTYGITSITNAGTNDNIDSDVDGTSLTSGSLDARPDGLPFIDMTTSAAGCGDHKYDMGLSCLASIDYADYNRPDNPCANPTCHIISSDIYLGSEVSSDTEGSANASANSDDDDGISILSTMQFTPGNTVRIPVSIYNNTGTAAYLRIWIDWDGDGDFEGLGEQVENSTYPSTGATNTVFVSLTVPLNATQIQAIALRTRLSTDDVNSAGPCGNGSCAADGEVEDYLIEIDCPTPICPPVSLQIRNN